MESYNLSEVTSFISRGITPKYTDDREYLVLNQKCIRNGQINLNLANGHDAASKKVSSEKELQKYDILVNSTGVGTLGRVAQLKSEIRNLTCDSHVTIVRPNSTNIDPSYLGYCLFSKQDEIENLGHGSTGQTELSRVALGNIKIPKIGSDEQKFAAYVLGLLDKKIELVQKTNKVIEEYCGTLFRSWFVEFDPVIENHKNANLSHGLNSLFPNEFISSECGNIPRGWKVVELKEIVRETGKNIKRSQQTISSPYVPIECIASKSLTLWDKKDGDEARSSLVSFAKKDILFGAMRPYFHKVCITPFNGTTRTTCLVLNSILPEYFGFALFTLFDEKTINFATINSSGTTMPYIKWNNGLGSLKVVAPPAHIAQKFNEMVAPFLSKILLGHEKLNSLSDIRDLLLPKLITGEFKVSDMEKILAKAEI